MMAVLPESPYRALRRAFIAACEARGVDAIARVHPAKGPDGKPLFMDAAALGPRDAVQAVLAVSDDAAGSALLTALLKDGATPPRDARLVLIHALDPAHFAGAHFVGALGDATWPGAMLAAVATEDLSHVTRLAVLNLTARRLEPALRAALPRAVLTVTTLAPGDFARADAQIRALLASF
jgi:hypothetical protein